MLNRLGGGGSLWTGGTTASGSAGRPGRGGRLKGAVPAVVTLCRLPGAGASDSARSGRSVTAVPPTTTTASLVTKMPSSGTFTPST